MKRILFPFFLLCIAVTHAQLNNSWIDYSNTYFKFKVINNGVCRINQPVLATAGLSNIPAAQFQLWRNGEQVRLFSSTTAAVLSTADYLEFLGEKNDGKPDKALYRDAASQLSDQFSLFSDTATYFLTVNPANNNLWFNNTVNNVATNALAPNAYFMRTVNMAFNNQYNLGFAQNVGEYIYSSSYDIGEGFTSATINPCCDLVQNFTNLNVYTGATAATVSFYITAAGTAFYSRNLQVKLNNNLLFNDVVMDNFNLAKKQVNNIPVSIFQNASSLSVAVNAVTTPPAVANANDRIVVGQLKFSYPSLFNFNNSLFFYFDLAASAAGDFLVIDNFNAGAVPPVLYSLSDGQRFTADQSLPGKLSFALPPNLTDTRKFCLVNETSANITNINELAPKIFTNFITATNQGDFIIISHPYLFNDGNGVNYVDQYKQYRASVAGGSYHPIIIPIDELNDQFSFGIKKHPAAIRDFIRFASQQFNTAPKYIFIIGRGMSAVDYKQNEMDPATDKIDLVQTFGWPASDVLLACNPGTNAPLVPIGRLAAITGTEIKYYLNKVKQYEQAQASPSQTIADKGWMKNIINVAGGADNDETNSFVSYLNGYKNILMDSAFGGYVETFVKASSAAVEQASGARIKELIDGGVSVIQYFGHSSANTLAFNLDDPSIYANQGRYPFFNISGCSAGNFYSFDPGRLTGTLTLSEKYILANQKGGIGFIASTYLGIPPFLDLFNTKLYTGLSTTMYGSTIGNQLKKNLELLGGNAPLLNFFTRVHLEQLNLHGDPAIKVNAFALPDFLVEDPLVKINPAIISVADNSFNLTVKMLNIGKVVKDSIRIFITRQLPDNSVKILYNQKIAAIKYADSLSFVVSINPITDKGLNTISITLDADNVVAELSKINNTLTKQFYILEDEIRPVFPYNYAIVNKAPTSFTASTANPLIGQRQYLMEIDTTALFNSGFKKQYTTNGIIGGVINFSADGISYKDSTVYYWRTAMVPLGGGQQIWNMFSFVYLPNGGTGFNQSHYFQQTANLYSNTISLDSDRVYRFKTISRALTINTGLYPYTTYDRINVNLDFDQLASYGCKYGSLQFLVYDSITLLPWVNYNSIDPVSGNSMGRFGSYPICNKPTRNFFEFPYSDINYRKKAMDFMDSIPAGMYVSVSNLGWIQNTSFISDWQSDQATLGTGKSLYHKLKAVGFSELDSFTHNLPFVFFYKKSTPQFIPQQKMGVLETDLLAAIYTLNTRYNSGTISSPVFGPARNWTALHWNGKPASATSHNVAAVQVIGVTNTGVETLLATVAPAMDTTLNFISTINYPFIKLKLLNADSITAVPNQLKYWTINADLVPEGAVAPNIFYTMKDTVELGAKIKFALAFKNIGAVNFDSLMVKLMITDQSNVAHNIPLPKTKALVPGDTTVIKYSIDTKTYPGNNTLYVMVNPDNVVPEQYRYNNFIYKNFYVRVDNTHPLLEVTFDGVHILNKDIVAARPHVLIKLKDESHFLALTDTALIKLRVLYPDGSTHIYGFGDSMRFTPANLATGQNVASIDFTPHFLVDGDYQLIVSGTDVMGNTAGNLNYQVSFSVINKPMISNLLNYPNPFTTSTAFVFTVTGSVVPQNMRIQILTITGKIVREITKAELGAIHVGRNITDFKWDGTDSFGQKLANGVYLYRVITNLNGRSLDKYKADGDNTDQYFNNGYGKMYLMR